MMTTCKWVDVSNNIRGIMGRLGQILYMQCTWDVFGYGLIENLKRDVNLKGINS